jgi:beta-RFAP synthase
MIEVVTGSRLHFGLLNPGTGDIGERRFGGAGLMVEQPGFRLRVSPAAEWSATGPLAERTLDFARRVTQALAQEGMSLRPQRLEVVSSPPEHAGLGTGTQLGMAVARALTVAAGRPDCGVVELARLAGRGLRSALGVHGFGRGGFLVEAGQAASATLAPLVAWSAVPDDWRVVLVLPSGGGNWHGQRERDAFSQLASAAPATTERLCRLILLGMLPALAEADLDAFGAAVHEYNALAGEAFAAVQGGTYTSARVAELVAIIRGLGVKGVGQSSWGPAVFALVGNREEAEALSRRLRQQAGLREEDVMITAALDRGAASECAVAQRGEESA